MCDCKHAEGKNAQGLIWCSKKNIYVSDKAYESCEYYEKK
jgi:hypothetical protein